MKINKLTNANVYANGNNFLGKADEVNLPQLKTKNSEHSPLGMLGSMDYPSGFDKLEATINWNSFYADVAKTFANPYEAVAIQLRGNLETFEGNSRVAEKSYVCHMKARSNDWPLGNFKSGQNAVFNSTLSVSYIKLEVDGEVIMEIDVEANIVKVGGVDLMAQYRANLGI